MDETQNSATQTNENCVPESQNQEKSQSRKRGKREIKKPDFAFSDHKTRKEFYQKCRSGKEKIETRLLDQDAYIERSKHPRECARKLYEHPCPLREVMYDGKPTGKYRNNVIS